ncbi:hypothetical protein [Streptomyces sp. NPDC021622]|uniref:hypothetical protein n=1 Tax=Streptomyces sp. NPDC021622 TaxID=3155013 RepID=UPI0033DC2E66
MTLRDVRPLTRLAKSRADAGDIDGAQSYALRAAVLRAADAGNTRALGWLAGLREKAGDAAGARRLLCWGLEGDGSPSQPW